MTGFGNIEEKVLNFLAARKIIGEDEGLAALIVPGAFLLGARYDQKKNHGTNASGYAIAAVLEAAKTTGYWLLITGHAQAISYAERIYNAMG